MAKTANDRLTIDQRLEKLGWQRELVHRIKKTGISCIVAVFGSGFLGALLSIIGIFDDPPEFFTVIIIVLFALAFVLPLVGYFAGMWVGANEKALASRMTPHILEDYIRHSDLGLPHYDRIRECQDYTKGVFRGIPLEFGEFTLEEEQTERDEDGDTKTSYVAVFSGLMVVCQHILTKHSRKEVWSARLASCLNAITTRSRFSTLSTSRSRCTTILSPISTAKRIF